MESIRLCLRCDDGKIIESTIKHELLTNFKEITLTNGKVILSLYNSIKDGFNEYHDFIENELLYIHNSKILQIREVNVTRISYNHELPSNYNKNFDYKKSGRCVETYSHKTDTEIIPSIDNDNDINLFELSQLRTFNAKLLDKYYYPEIVFKK